MASILCSIPNSKKNKKQQPHNRVPITVQACVLACVHGLQTVPEAPPKHTPPFPVCFPNSLRRRAEAKRAH